MQVSRSINQLLTALGLCAALAAACVPATGPRGGGGSSSGAAALRLLVEPDDGPAALIDAIRTARRQVLVEVYLLTADDVLAALLDAQAAGRQVRVLLEPAPYGTPTANQTAFATLAAAGVDVRWVSVPNGLVHAKYLIVDGATAFVLTLNLTGAGIGLNREYAIVDADPTDVAWATALWNADAIADAPGQVPHATRVLASPIDARARLATAIDAARTSIAIEMEELSDGDFVTRLTAACARGAAVTIVAPALDRSPSTTGALQALAATGVTVRVLGAPAVHAKTMVVDGRRVYVGSVNFTRASFDDNREIGILFDDAQTAARITATTLADAAKGDPL